MNIVYSGPPQATSPSATTATGGSWFSLIFMLLLFFLMFYFLVVIPQKRKEKEFQRMVSSMKRGDTVITVGGIVGRVIAIDKDTIKIKTANATEIEVTKRGIATVIKAKEEKKEEKKEG